MFVGAGMLKRLGIVNYCCDTWNGFLHDILGNIIGGLGTMQL